MISMSASVCLCVSVCIRLRIIVQVLCASSLAPLNDSNSKSEQWPFLASICVFLLISGRIESAIHRHERQAQWMSSMNGPAPMNEPVAGRTFSRHRIRPPKLQSLRQNQLPIHWKKKKKKKKKVKKKCKPTWNGPGVAGVVGVAGVAELVNLQWSLVGGHCRRHLKSAAQFDIGAATSICKSYANFSPCARIDIQSITTNSVDLTSDFTSITSHYFNFDNNQKKKKKKGNWSIND